MKFLKRFGVLLTLSLAFGLFCGEIPESFNLSDDASNDFVEAKFSARHATDSHLPRPSCRFLYKADSPFRAGSSAVALHSAEIIALPTFSIAFHGSTQLCLQGPFLVGWPT